MSKIAPICSSSKGNCVFIGDSGSGILVDAGCSFKELKCRLDCCGIPFEAVKAVVVTHEHSDHTKALMQISKHTDIPIYASEGTMKQLLSKKLVENTANLYTTDYLLSAPIDIEIKAFHTPHDTAESVGYTFSWNEHRVAVCTDLGYVTNEVRENLTGCDSVYIEANYEPSILRANQIYPPWLKERISSDHGHLSNPDSAEFCSYLVKNGARRLILGHLSQENNTPRTAYEAVSSKLSQDGIICGRDCTLDVAPVTTEGKYILI